MLKIPQATEKVTLKSYGHATFMLSHGDVHLLLDPFFTGNSWNIAKPEDISCQYIFVSHGHDDHYGDTDSIAARNNALIISTKEVCAKAAAAGARVHEMHIGGSFDFEFGTIKLVPAMHGAGVPGGQACGAVINFYGKTVYFAGDTGLFGDMKLINRDDNLDYALLPIGDNYTMGVEDAALAASWIHANTTIPMHYKTWPVIDREPSVFTALLETKYNQAAIVVDPGETIVL